MILFDFTLIIMGCIFSFYAYKRICFEKNASVANYAILIIFVFCVIPILCNYIIGIPTYISQYWYKPFINPMKNEVVGII